MVIGVVLCDGSDGGDSGYGGGDCGGWDKPTRWSQSNSSNKIVFKYFSHIILLELIKYSLNWSKSIEILSPILIGINLKCIKAC